MADINVSFFSGEVITVKLYNEAGVQVGADISTTEIGTIGEYRGSVPAGVPYGRYMAIGFYNGGKMGAGELFWDGAKEISPIMYQKIFEFKGLDSSKPTNYTKVSATQADFDSPNIHLDISTTGNSITTQAT